MLREKEREGGVRWDVKRGNEESAGWTRRKGGHTETRGTSGCFSMIHHDAKENHAFDECKTNGLGVALVGRG